MTALAVTLTAAERDHLAECEERIARGLDTFLEVGSALLDVRDNRLYRAFPTFEVYCAERWGISRPRAYALMTAAKAVSSMEDIPSGLPAPVNERQARELAKAPTADRAAAWAEAMARTDGHPTAAAVRDVIAERHPQTPAPSATAPDVADTSGIRGPVGGNGGGRSGDPRDLPPAAPPARRDPDAAIMRYGTDSDEYRDAELRRNVNARLLTLYSGLVDLDARRVAEAADDDLIARLADAQQRFNEFVDAIHAARRRASMRAV